MGAEAVILVDIVAAFATVLYLGKLTFMRSDYQSSAVNNVAWRREKLSLANQQVCRKSAIA